MDIEKNVCRTKEQHSQWICQTHYTHKYTRSISWIPLINRDRTHFINEKKKKRINQNKMQYSQKNVLKSLCNKYIPTGEMDHVCVCVRASDCFTFTWTWHCVHRMFFLKATHFIFFYFLLSTKYTRSHNVPLIFRISIDAVSSNKQ